MTSVPGAIPGRHAAPRTIRVATRSSPQATAQATVVADALGAAGFRTELVPVDTHGDRTQAAQVPLHTIGGQGVFTKEIQLAVLDGRADVAVHSAKDLPTELVPGLRIGALPPRRDPRDALIGLALDDLALGATVASGSVRRRAQLADRRPDLRFVELRGNIHTRLGRIPDGGSIVMAVAALDVLGLADRIAQILDPDEFVPAVGQGAVAVECRSDDPEVLAALATIDDPVTRHAVTVERAWLGTLGSGCSAPLGAHVAGGVLSVFLAGTDRVHRRQIELTGDLDHDVRLATEVAGAARVDVGV
ncbi:MAG: porphobilinogen deaminase [Actinomycetota bacterium]|jgi:hydroxymethylbilane synthase